jgi:hypothetical protein
MFRMKQTERKSESGTRMFFASSATFCESANVIEVDDSFCCFPLLFGSSESCSHKRTVKLMTERVFWCEFGEHACRLLHVWE